MLPGCPHPLWCSEVQSWLGQSRSKPALLLTREAKRLGSLHSSILISDWSRQITWPQYWPLIGRIIQRLCLIPIHIVIGVIAEAGIGRSDNMMHLLRVCCFLLAFILEVKGITCKASRGIRPKNKYSPTNIWYYYLAEASNLAYFLFSSSPMVIIDMVAVMPKLTLDSTLMSE